MFKRFLEFVTCLLILVNSLSLKPQRFFAEEFDIPAPSAILIEPISRKILYEKNSHDERAAASVTKVMELLCFMEQLDNNGHSINDRVVISDSAASAKGANVWLKENEILTVAELIKAVAMVSANDASVALAEYFFGTAENCVTRMNERAKEMNLENTKFVTLETTDESEGTTSAADIAAITAELAKHEKIFDFSKNLIDSIRNGNTQIVNTNRLVKTYEGTIGIKTGTDKSSGSCVSAVSKRNGLTMIAVILGAENVKERDKSTIALFEYGFSNFKKLTPKLPEDFPQSAKVLDGMQNEVKIDAQIDKDIFVMNSKKIDEVPEIYINNEIFAPIKAGDVLGKVSYKSGGEIIAQYDITAAENVEEAGFKPMFVMFIKKFFAL